MKYLALMVLVTLMGCASVPRPQDSRMMGTLNELAGDLQSQLALKRAEVVDLNQQIVALQDEVVWLRTQLQDTPFSVPVDVILP